MIDLTSTNIVDGGFHSTVMVGLLPVDVTDNKVGGTIVTTGVDSVSKTANKDDPGYQEDFWIMAPLQGPESFAYENSTRIQIGMGATDVGELSSANATSDPTTLELNGTPPKDIDWQGTGNGIDSEETVKLKINGDQTARELPVRIKTMKYREVVVRVYPVRHKQNFAAVPVPNALTFKQELNKIFAYQLNAWITLDIQPEEFYDYAGASGTGFDDGYLLTAKAQAEQDMINDSKFPRENAHIVVFLIDRTAYISDGTKAYGSAWPPAALPLSTDNVCVVNVWDNDFSAARSELAVIRTVAHEMGHVMLGEGHPDVDAENPNGAGVAPLVGADPKKRLMHKFAYQEIEAKLLVKKEWDAAEQWLKKFINVP